MQLYATSGLILTRRRTHRVLFWPIVINCEPFIVKLVTACPSQTLSSSDVIKMVVGQYFVCLTLALCWCISDVREKCECQVSLVCDLNSGRVVINSLTLTLLTWRIW